jgi:prepilin-type N-terminal cleavage/methylation domain-containing protein
MTRPRPAGDAGYTLSEVLIAVVILSVALSALVTALGSAIFVSRVHRNIATSDSVVRVYAEQILATAYKPCAISYPAVTNQPAGFTATIVSIEYGDALTGANPTQTFAMSLATCQTSGDNGVERITIQAHPIGGPGQQSLQIVKRNPVQT